jgi:Tfp pilus assembly protein PilF
MVASATMQGAQATFQGIGAGRFSVEAIAPGYVTNRVDVNVEFAGAAVSVEISLKPDGDPKNANAAAAGPPVLAPKAQKELNKGLDALRANKPEEARKHLEVAEHLAPGNPDVIYLLGVLASMTGKRPEALALWQKAIDIYPQHTFALLAMGDSSVQGGDLPAAAAFFKRAADSSPSSWRSQVSLADVAYRQQLYEDANKYAENALKIGKDKANDARFVQARVEIALGRREKAIVILHNYLAQAPAETRFAEQAKHLLAGLLAAPLETPKVTAVSAPSTAKPSPAVASAALLPNPAEWLPPDVDAAIPPTTNDVACPLTDILSGTGKRVTEFLHTVDRFTATEHLHHEDIGFNGMPSGIVNRTFYYLVSIEEIRPRVLNVEEYRNGTMSMEDFPSKLATKGFPSLALVFHPYYRENYDMSCEGLSTWHGHLAWQVHFRQRPDKPSQMMTFRMNGGTYPVSLKGRAWISTTSNQIFRLEFDMVVAIPEIRLRAEHITVDYGPVQFRNHDVRLWLPNSAEIFMDFRGRRLHRIHNFSDYLLFSVDDKQKIQKPAEEPAAEGVAEKSQPVAPRPAGEAEHP